MSAVTEYQGNFYNSVYLKAPTLTTVVSVVALLGGLALGLYGGSELIINGVSRDAFLYLGGGVMATGLASWCIHEIRRGNSHKPQKSEPPVVPAAPPVEPAPPVKQWAWKPIGSFYVNAYTSEGSGPEHISNQDTCFCAASDTEVLFGVFDGHNYYGRDVARLGMEEFPRLFDQYRNAGNIPGTLKKATAELQHKASAFQHGGAVMAVGHIDLATKKLTTASLGDAAILHFRGEGQKVVCNKVTKEKNWHDLWQKLAEANKKRSFKFEYETYEDALAKPRLFVDDEMASNFTGSIGDHTAYYDLVLQREPDIQETTIEEGDYVGAFSDGIGDFHPLLDDVVEKYTDPSENLVQKMTERVREIPENVDDCTGVMIYVPPTKL